MGLIASLGLYNSEGMHAWLTSSAVQRPGCIASIFVPQQCAVVACFFRCVMIMPGHFGDSEFMDFLTTRYSSLSLGKISPLLIDGAFTSTYQYSGICSFVAIPTRRTLIEIKRYNGPSNQFFRAEVFQCRVNPNEQSWKAKKYPPP